MNRSAASKLGGMKSRQIIHAGEIHPLPNPMERTEAQNQSNFEQEARKVKARELKAM
jgi:hypothetical protein